MGNCYSICSYETNYLKVNESLLGWNNTRNVKFYKQFEYLYNKTFTKKNFIETYTK